MQITDVQVFNAKKDGAVKGFARVVLDNTLTLSGFRIVNGRNGLFIGNPGNFSNGRQFDTVTPDEDLKGKIDSAILAAYN